LKALKEIITTDPVNSYTRVEALRGLIELAKTDDETFEYILKLGNDENPIFRHKWARLLRKSTDSRVAQAFLEQLEAEEDTHTIRTMIRSLAKCGDESCIGLLETFLEHQSFSIRHAAKVTIEELLYKKPEEIEEPTPEAPQKENIARPRHKLPWRLGLKFFLRKYRYAIFAVLIIASIYPVSIGFYHSIVGIKNIIVSYQPSPEEIAERKKLEEQRRLEQERKRLEEQRRLEQERKRLEEQRRLEQERKKLEEQRKKLKKGKSSRFKWLNWGSIIASIVIAALCFQAFLLAMQLLKYLSSLKQKLVPTQSKTTLSVNDSKALLPEINEEKEKTKAQITEDAEVRPPEGLTPAKRKAWARAREAAIVQLSKKSLFSIFDRFFRLFKMNYSKNVPLRRLL
jgi:hypothetical protein